MVTLNTVCEHFMHLDNLYENILNYLPICKNNTTSLNHFVEKLTEIENETKDDETLIKILHRIAVRKLDTFILNRLEKTDTFYDFKISLLRYRLTYRI